MRCFVACVPLTVGEPSKHRGSGTHVKTGAIEYALIATSAVSAVNCLQLLANAFWRGVSLWYVFW